ncbi:MAG: mechanosensitive ion channel family protein [Geminocystis sp.]|nr:mechanosensitive ion channel family protein [Geminocystis sp.]
MWPHYWFNLPPIFRYILIFVAAFPLLYVFLNFVLLPLFRRLETDIPLVTLNLSITPILTIFILLYAKFIFSLLDFSWQGLTLKFLNAALIIVLSSWSVTLLKQVLIYYLREYTKQTEVMWDDVLLPLVGAISPVIIFLVAAVFVLKNFGVDLTGIWVALGGATFIIGFALKDILANFFSGIVLLIDTPFQFGDVLRLEDGTIGMLQRIGVRVTKLYLFNRHCEVYIPNSILQNQTITNLSRPTSYYYYTSTLEIPAQLDIDYIRNLITEIVLAHPDTLADIDTKIRLIDKYYVVDDPSHPLNEQQKYGKLRLLAEQKVNQKLQEIEESLEALVVTLQFAEKGGLTSEEISNIYQEYQQILYLMGLVITPEAPPDNSLNLPITESKDTSNLIDLVRQWYRIWLKDPNLKEEDLYLIPQEWEIKINLLKKRTYRLYQKITKPKREETRLDDYVLELNEWLKSRFKERNKWQEPQIWIKALNHDEGYLYYQFQINFCVDDIKLEYGQRGDRICSQINQEILRCLEPSLKNHIRP